MVSQHYRNIRSTAQSQPSVLYSLTLVHPTTGDERRISVWSQSDSFADVMFAVSRKRAELGLKGYVVAESDRVDVDFSSILDRMGLKAALVQLHSEISCRIIDRLEDGSAGEAREILKDLERFSSHASGIRRKLKLRVGRPNVCG